MSTTTLPPQDPLKGLDTADIITLTKALALYKLGYRVIMAYLRLDRLPLSMVAAIHAAGMQLASIYERGNPTSDGYGWTYEHGKADGKIAADYAVSIGQPSGTTISPCCDFDSNPEVVKPYLEGFHDEIKTYGYFMLPYANGVTIENIIKAGYAIGGFLTQSTGFSGYHDYFAHASVQQGASATVTGLDVDKDTIVTPKIATSSPVHPIVSLVW